MNPSRASWVGAPPHAGLAFGLDRLCTIIGGKVGELSGAGSRVGTRRFPLDCFIRYPIPSMEIVFYLPT